MRSQRVLLINPYIYDFAAYDLWSKPLGLLLLGGLLRSHGAEVHLIDAMDRHHPAVRKRFGPARSRPFGDGHYHKVTVDTPRALGPVPRRYSRYGMPPDILQSEIESISQPPDLILVTSGMTYWYPGVHETIQMCRQVFGGIPIWLGGIYATLFPEHAAKHSGADRIVVGEGEPMILEWLGSKISREVWPAYDLYPHLDYVAIRTTQGCPYACSFCATHEFSADFRRRRPEDVIAEIEAYAAAGIRHITFYDDALFVHAERHIKVILRHFQKSGLNFHTPNGLFARLLDEEMAHLMVGAGFRTVRLSYETKNAERQKALRKVTDSDLERALCNLEAAGFPRGDVTVYLIMGLPDQRPEEVEDSIGFVHDLGARVSLSSYSPIPGTPDWRESVHRYGFPTDEPLLTNKSVFPLRRPDFPAERFEALKRMAVNGNRLLDEEATSDYSVYA